MSLEQAIQENTAAVKALVAAIASMGALAPAAAASAEKPAADAAIKKPETKKPETKKEETKKPEVKGVEWKTVLDKIKELNASTAEGHGRAGVEAVLAKFGKAGQKVPSLESVGKNAEILAFVESLLAGGEQEAESEDDLGI